MIHACQAGKDVYVEKPLSLCVAEGRAMVEAARAAQARRAGRHPAAVVAVRARRRPSSSAAAAIGKVTVGARVPRPERVAARASAPRPTRTPPPGLRLGRLARARRRSAPYNKNRTFYRFRWFYDYSGGQLTNFGVHYLDAIHWALGHDAPLAVTAMGGKFAIDDNREVPDTLEVLWTIPAARW